MLLKVYDSPVCDRREEGHAFVPPDPSMEHQGLPRYFDRTTELPWKIVNSCLFDSKH